MFNIKWTLIEENINLQKINQSINLKYNQKDPKMFPIRCRGDWKTSRQGIQTFISVCLKKKPVQADSTKFIFAVPIGSAKKSEVADFHPHAPGIKYIQDD